MRKRDATLALLGAGAVACAGACNLLGTLPVQGTPESEGGSSSSAGDASDGGAFEADLDAGPDAPRRQLVEGEVLTLQGVTSDDYAVYIDGLRATLCAVSLSGGTPVDIAPVDPAAVVQVSREVVFAWTATDQTIGEGTLTTWTAAHGAHVLSTSSLAGSWGGQAMAVSPDSSKVAFYEQLPALTNDFANLEIAGVDGSGRTTLLTYVELSDSNCYPVFRFVGDDTVVVASERPGESPTVIALAGPGWTPTTLVHGADCTFDVDSSGGFVLAVNSWGLAGYSIGGGPPMIIDTAGQAGLFVGPLDSGGGAGGAADDVVYLERNGGLRRAPFAPMPPSTVLVNGGLQRILAVSGDRSWVLANDQTSNFYGYVDMYLASTRVPGSLTTLVSGATGMLAGDSFTADSAYALYATTAPADADGGLSGFFAAATASPSAGASAGGYLSASVVADFASGGSKVVFSATDPGTPVVFDIFSAELSTGAPPERLVSMADSPFFLSAARDKVVYTLSMGPQAGLYVQELP
jgi:hypothetical protein